jgi:mannose-1-phosphate guanylyltransferase
VIYGIILAGGKGERFWPLSRADRPKQFLCLTSEKTMLAETIERVTPLIPLDNIRIVTGESRTKLIVDSAAYVSPKQMLTEPIGRNTCLAIGLAAVHVLKDDPHAVMVVLSADHLIRPPERLLKILQHGTAIAVAEDKLITMGIVPTRPETGYGYIKLGEQYNVQGDGTVYHVSAFAEKPKAAVAQEYYFSRKYLWNAGMFIWSAKSILSAINKFQPETGELLARYALTIGTSGEQAARRELYQKAPSISIDYAVLEKADNVLTIKADMLWDDIGSWNSLERYKERDSDNNTVSGSAVLHETYECTVHNDADGLIACLGISDLVVVRSGDIILVAHKTKVGQIKELLAKLNENENLRKYL